MSLPSFAGVLGKPHKVESVGDSAMGVSLQGDTLYCIADDSLYALDVSARPCGLWVVPMDGIKPQPVDKGKPPADCGQRGRCPSR